MRNKTLTTYQIIVSLAATLSGLWTLVTVMHNPQSPWLAVAGMTFILVWIIILVTAIPVVNKYSHDREDDGSHHP